MYNKGIKTSVITLNNHFHTQQRSTHNKNVLTMTKPLSAKDVKHIRYLVSYWWEKSHDATLVLLSCSLQLVGTSYVIASWWSVVSVLGSKDKSVSRLTVIYSNSHIQRQNVSSFLKIASGDNQPIINVNWLIPQFEVVTSTWQQNLSSLSPFKEKEMMMFH